MKSPEEQLLAHLDRIERAAAHACRRYGLSAEEVEDFTSKVKLKLIEDDYRVLREFRGHSKLSTYLVTVINNAARDHVDHLWGKWRPSREARRRGPDGVLFERLLVRDGRDFEEACRLLRDNHGVSATTAELADLAARFPPRAGRRLVGDDELEHRRGDDAESAERRVIEGELRERWQQALAALEQALAALAPEDRLIVELRVELTVADIARTLGLEQKPLYRRLARLYSDLRRRIEDAGVSPEDARELTGAGGEEVFSKPE